jgi:hypothetical protein
MGGHAQLTRKLTSNNSESYQRHRQECPLWAEERKTFAHIEIFSV